MRKLLFALIAIFALQGTVQATDKPIQIDKLPQAAQTFLKKHFNNAKVSYAMVDDELMNKDYKVVFDNGSKVEFDKKGEWKDVDCKKSAVPSAIVPTNLQSFVKSNHKGQKIVQIDRDSRGYEVDLSNGMTIKFDSKFKLIGYDD